jgi:hypothetical protein
MPLGGVVGPMRIETLLSIGLACSLLLGVPAAGAHTCHTLMPQAPWDPSNPDTGCIGNSCPTNAGSDPHWHVNDLPPQSCYSCTRNCAMQVDTTAWRSGVEEVPVVGVVLA